MKLSIRFSDQIVGALIVLALGIVVFVIFLLGSNQRWFSRDYKFKTYFDSATGLSQNMPIQYKGFNIGRVKTFDLTDDNQVEVRFIIFDTYIDRIRRGSLVEMVVSPISALGGNQFLLYPGKGEQLDEGETIPTVDSPEGKLLIAQKLTTVPERGDSISKIINDVGVTIASLNHILEEVQNETVGSVNDILAGLQPLPNDIQKTLEDLKVQIEPILANLGEFSDMVSDPNGSVGKILDADGEAYKEIINTFTSLAGTLKNLEQTSDVFPEQFPRMLAELQTALDTAEDVLVSLTNNPLLKGGIPERKESNTGGAYTRDMEF